MVKLSSTHRLNYLQLFIFPAVFLAMQIMLKIDYKWFYLSSHDPVYAFLFNGLNIAQGNFQLGLSGFPGTTLQCLVALNLVAGDLFNGNTPLTEAVISNPEPYLQIISYEIVAFNTIALIVLGLYTYNRIRSLPLSLALQLTPFVTLKAFSGSSVIMLEPLMQCIEILIIAIVAVYTFGNRNSLNTKNLILTGILISLGIATKIVFLPLALLPFFAIDGFRKKLLYTLIIVVSLAIFLIPIYPTFSSFLRWNFAVLTHTGSYGSGKYDLFDAAIYSENLKSIFRANIFFTIAFFLVTVTTLTACVSAIKRKIEIQKLKILAGLTMVFIVSVLMVAKHYSAHYLYNAFNLSVFGFILVISVLPFQRISNSLSVQWPKVAGVYMAGGFLIYLLVSGIQYSPSLQNPRLKAVDFVKSSVRNTQRIIVLESSGPFMETALYHGLAYSNGLKAKYSRILKSAYPSSFFYNVGQQNLHDWIHDYNLFDILSRSSKTFIYCRSKNDTFPPVLRNKLAEMQLKNLIKSFKTSYSDKEYREYIYEIETDTQEIAGTIIKHYPVFCDFDSISENREYFSTTDSLQLFSGTSLQSNQKSFSGASSVKLDPAHPYGPGIKIIPDKGFYEISVMRISGDGNGLIVAADSIGTKLYKSNASATEAKNGWELIKLTVDIPKDLIGEQISVFLWYPGRRSCYFDDMTITYYKVGQE